MSSKTKWVERWRMLIAEKASLPGVWAIRDGGFVVRARVKDPSGKVHHIFKVLGAPDVTAAQAFAWLEAERDRHRAGPQDGILSPTTRFDAYAARLFERKIAEGSIRSAAGRRKWLDLLGKHLLPAFGSLEIPSLRRAQIIAWRDGVATRVAAGEVSPRTANTWLALLKTIVSAYVAEYELAKNPALDVAVFPTIDRPTHSDEAPNALAPADVPRFLQKLRECHPQHYAMAVLGFSLGLRPSSLRPLRRCGPQTDIDWNTGDLKVRRSQTYREEVMESTKQGTRERKSLPPELVEILRWHVDHHVHPGPMQDSELLFPSETGGYRSRTVLDKPFAQAARAIGLRYRVTAKAMRRTYQDLAREAGVPDIVTRSISGHMTEEMQNHYSTVHREEQRRHIARVIDLAGVRASTRNDLPSKEPTRAMGG